MENDPTRESGPDGAGTPPGGASPGGSRGRRPEADPAPAGEDDATPRIQSSDLFGSGRRIIIEHRGREYSLLITRQGKLVLNRF